MSLRIRKFLLAYSPVVVATVLSAPLAAHHSGAMFDNTKKIAVHGTVKEFQYTNPHSWLLLVVRRPDGVTVEWSFETEGPSSLMRAGIKPKSFQPGDEVTVTANPMRDGRLAGALLAVKTADGIVHTLRP
jgi:Family of unknown function (DUF6152)